MAARKHQQRFITEEEILAAILSNSDVEDFSEDEGNDLSWGPTGNMNLGASSSESSSDTDENDVQQQQEVQQENDQHQQRAGNNATASVRRHIWRKRPFPKKDISTGINKDVQESRTPLNYFYQYFNEEIFELVSVYTNMYHMSKKGKNLGTNSQEIKAFFEMHIIMGCVKYPRIKMYWQRGYRLPLIADCKSRDRFFVLRVALHVIDTNRVPNEANENHLWKVQPIIDAVRNTCLTLFRRSDIDYSIDEQMIPFTGRCKLLQYVPNKPRPVGLKIFVVATSKGFVVVFEIYQGRITRLPQTGLGLGPNVVLRLSESLPQGAGLYFDRYFTTLGLMDSLKERGFEATGTIMRNRIKEVHLSVDKSMKRGDMEEFCREDDKVVVVQWKDSKSVTLASTLHGCEPVENVKRWCKSRKEYISVPCPAIVRHYNKTMGGVDISDQLIEAYITLFKTKKWTLKVILHLLDLVCVNSWLQYREDCQLTQVLKKDTMDLLQFRMSLGESLISSPTGKPYETSSESENESEPLQKKYRPASAPSIDKKTR